MNRLLPILALAAGLAALGACSDSPSASTDSKDNVQVQVIASIGAPSFTPLNDSTTILECALTLTASATGPNGARAEWNTATFLFYVGPNRTVSFDTAVVSADEVSAGWGAGTITAGGAQVSQWVLRASVPFALGGEMQYRTVGSTTVHTARFDPVSCGPSVPVGAAAPTVSILQVSPSGGEMQVSDSITVSWTATAPAGVWESLITVVTGNTTARYRTRGAFQATDARTQRIRLPYGAALGSPAHVSVTVTDSWLRSASAGPQATATVVDRTPPQLLSATTSYYQSNLGAHLSGQYGAGDSVKIWTIATDENGLANLVWELDAPISARDSLPLQGLPGVPVSIPVRAGWSGAAKLRVWVTDRAGNRSVVMESPDGGVRFYPQVTRPTQSLVLPGESHDAVIDPVARRVYLAMEETQRIVPVSIGTMTMGTPIELPGYATAVDLTPGRDSLVAALAQQKALALVDLASSSVTVVPVDAPGLTGPYALRLGANGRVVAAMAAVDGHIVVVEIDRRTGAIQQKGTGSTAFSSTMRMRTTPDRSRIGLWSGCVYIYRVSDGSLGACLPRGTRANFALDAQAEVYTTAEHIFTTTGTGGYTFPEIPAITASAPGPDGSVYLSSTRGLLRARTDGAVLDRSELPLMYGDLLFLDGGATLVAFTNESLRDNRMFVVTLH